MKKELDAIKTKTRPHSQEYFGETRDHWWKHDYLKLMAGRWNLKEVGNVLDVGCGVGGVFCCL